MKVMNRLFHRNYQTIEQYETGIMLTGAEVKSVKLGRIKLEQAFVKIIDSQAYLINAEISIYPYARPEGYDSKRTRKLLLHKKEIIRLKTKQKTGRRLTIVPVACYNKGGFIKIVIALAKGRRELEKKKRQRIKDIRMEEKREMKEYLKRRISNLKL